MAVVLRAAREADVPFLAEVLCMAGRGHLARGIWDLALPSAAERTGVLQRLAGGDVPSWCHRTAFHVAEQDGVAGSALVAFEPGTVGDTSLARPLWTALAPLGADHERQASLATIFATYLRCFPPMAPGTWVVENVGTRPELRRRGLLARLLERGLEAGRHAGLRSAQISCLIENDAARRAYEQAGFRVVEERTDPAFHELLGVPGFSRLTVTL